MMVNFTNARIFVKILWTTRMGAGLKRIRYILFYLFLFSMFLGFGIEI